MYITKYSCVFLKLGESIYVAMDLIPILLGSLPLAHNAQHSLVIEYTVTLLLHVDRGRGRSRGRGRGGVRWWDSSGDRDGG